MTPEGVRDRLTDALKEVPAGYADLRFEEESGLNFGYRGEQMDHLHTHHSAGGLARVYHQGRWGISTFDEIEEAEGALREAWEAARWLGGPEDGQGPASLKALDEIPILSLIHLPRWTRDFRGVKLDDKLSAIAKLNRILLRSDPAVESSFVTYGEGLREIHFANTRGSYFFHGRPLIAFSFWATARAGREVQQVGDSVCSTHDFGILSGREESVEQAGRRAAALLKAPPVPSGRMTVVLDPELAGVWAHEAFGHLTQVQQFGL
jgi:TldD protein